VPEVRAERTGWRDSALSERHRGWGWDCPMLDIDFLVCEYDEGEARGLVEYKHESAAESDLSSPSYRAIEGLASNSFIPFFLCRYRSDFTGFFVVPMNDYAERYACASRWMTEGEWVDLLYRIRGRCIPGGLLGVGDQQGAR
jgi:hypothetical protein